MEKERSQHKFDKYFQITVYFPDIVLLTEIR